VVKVCGATWVCDGNIHNDYMTCDDRGVQIIDVFVVIYSIFNKNYRN
jgi:hypothetical protein